MVSLVKGRSGPRGLSVSEKKKIKGEGLLDTSITPGRIREKGQEIGKKGGGKPGPKGRKKGT